MACPYADACADGRTEQNVTLPMTMSLNPGNGVINWQ